jgi:hypothetical protein
LSITGLILFAVMARFPHPTLGALRALSRTQSVEFRVTVDAAIWVRNENVSAPIRHKFNGLFEGRRSRVSFERQSPG